MLFKVHTSMQNIYYKQHCINKIFSRNFEMVICSQVPLHGYIQNIYVHLFYHDLLKSCGDVKFYVGQMGGSIKKWSAGSLYKSLHRPPPPLLFEKWTTRKKNLIFFCFSFFCWQIGERPGTDQKVTHIRI